jgi:hypothetical protein
VQSTLAKDDKRDTLKKKKGVCVQKLQHNAEDNVNV